MIPLDVIVNILSVVVAALGGAWVGSSRCNLAVEIDSNDDWTSTWLDRCWPVKKIRRSATQP